MSIWDLFKSKDCSQVTAQKDKQIQDLTNSLSNLTAQNELIKNNYINSANMVKNLTIEKDNLNLIIKKLTPNTKEKQLEDYWNNKYNRAMITYPGQSLPFSTIKCNVPVCVLITPNDPFIINDLQEWGLYRTNEEPETLLPKIYKKVSNKMYNYQFDNKTWGVNEVWEFVFQMREKSKNEKDGKWRFDCDSWANLLVSYFICAGVPRWRVRVVAGDTNSGGHSTTYAFSMVDNKWHHLNSTYNDGNYDNLNQYWTHEDAKSPTNPKGQDGIGIYNVWCSFNDIYSWYKFETDLPKEMQVII